MRKIFFFLLAVSLFIACNNSGNTDQYNHSDSLMPLDNAVVDSANATIQRWNDSAKIRMDSAGKMMKDDSGVSDSSK